MKTHLAKADARKTSRTLLKRSFAQLSTGSYIPPVSLQSTRTSESMKFIHGATLSTFATKSSSTCPAAPNASCFSHLSTENLFSHTNSLVENIHFQAPRRHLRLLLAKLAISLTPTRRLLSSGSWFPLPPDVIGHLT